MSINGIKKIIMGEPEPDENDPKYQDRKKRDNEAGATFARVLRLDKAAVYVQRFAEKHTKLFLTIVFIFILVCVSLNIFRMCNAYSRKFDSYSAIQRQERELNFKRHPQRQTTNNR